MPGGTEGWRVLQIWRCGPSYPCTHRIEPLLCRHVARMSTGALTVGQGRRFLRASRICSLSWLNIGLNIYTLRSINNNININTWCDYHTVVVFTLNRSFYPTISTVYLYPSWSYIFEIQILSSQWDREKPNDAKESRYANQVLVAYPVREYNKRKKRHPRNTKE